MFKSMLKITAISLLMASPDLGPILNPLMEAFNNWLFPVLIGVLTIIGIPTFIKKGMALMKAEDENQKIAAQKSLVTAVIAFVLIFVLIVGFKLAMPIMQEWVESII